MFFVNGEMVEVSRTREDTEAGAVADEQNQILALNEEQVGVPVSQRGGRLRWGCDFEVFGAQVHSFEEFLGTAQGLHRTSFLSQTSPQPQRIKRVGQ